MPSQYSPAFLTRFWSKVDTSDQCWPWIGRTNRAGYGCFDDTHGSILAHRIAWSIRAPIPAGLFVLHTCDNRPCTRNDDEGVYVLDGISRPRWGHLWLGTYADNARDMVIKGRSKAHTHPELAKRGSSNPGAKLTEAMVIAIRERRSAGEMRQSIAADYDITPSLVTYIAQRKIWKHV